MSTERPCARGLPGRGRRASGARDAGELMPNAAFRYRRINPNEEIVNKGQSIQVRGGYIQNILISANVDSYYNLTTKPIS